MMKPTLSILAVSMAAFFFFVVSLTSAEQPPMVNLSDIGSVLTGESEIVISSLELSDSDAS